MLLPYLRNRLQVESTHALLCLGDWVRKGVIKEKDALAALKGIPELGEEEQEEELEDGWDSIVV